MCHKREKKNVKEWLREEEKAFRYVYNSIGRCQFLQIKTEGNFNGNSINYESDESSYFQ